MQYCNDCFAKLDDQALHCAKCQSRDIRAFESSNPNKPSCESEQIDLTPTASESRLKVDRQFLVVPKESETTKPADTLYFHPGAEHRERQAKQQRDQKIFEKRVADANVRASTYLDRYDRRRKRTKVFWLVLSLLALVAAVMIANPGEIRSKLFADSAVSQKSNVSAGKGSPAIENESGKSDSSQLPTNSIEDSGDWSIKVQSAFYVDGLIGDYYSTVDTTGLKNKVLVLNVELTNTSKKLKQLGFGYNYFELQGANLEVFQSGLDAPNNYSPELNAELPRLKYESGKAFLHPHRPGEKALIRLVYLVSPQKYFDLSFVEAKAVDDQVRISGKSISAGWYDFKQVQLPSNFSKPGALIRSGSISAKLNRVAHVREGEMKLPEGKESGDWITFDITVTNVQDSSISLGWGDYGYRFELQTSDGPWPVQAYSNSQEYGELLAGQSRRITLAYPWTGAKSMVLSLEGGLFIRHAQNPNDTYVLNGVRWSVSSKDVR